MPATPDSYEAKALDHVITMLTRSVSFRALVGATTATAARAWVIEQWGGPPSKHKPAKAVACDGSALITTPPFAIVRCAGMDTQLAGVGSWDYRGSVTVELLLPTLRQGEAPAEAFRRAANVAGAVRSDMQAQFGAAADVLATGSIRVDGPILPDGTGPDADSIIVFLEISWEG